jgi:hypothetical protein
MNQTENFYLRTKDYWLRFFKGFVEGKKMQSVWLKYISPEELPEIKKEMQQEFEALLPQIPDFGQNKVDRMTTDMMKNTQSLAFYRVMKARGVPLRTMGQMMHELSEAYYDNLNPLVKMYLRARSYAPSFKKNLKKTIEKRNENPPHPENYHVKYIEGDGQNLVFGLDYSNCAATHLLRKHNALELHPYLCLCDYPMMRALKIGFNREQNIAIGGSVCAFRMYRNFPTPRGWPPEEVPEYRNYVFSESSS